MWPPRIGSNHTGRASEITKPFSQVNAGSDDIEVEAVPAQWIFFDDAVNATN